MHSAVQVIYKPPSPVEIILARHYQSYSLQSYCKYFITNQTSICTSCWVKWYTLNGLLPGVFRVNCLKRLQKLSLTLEILIFLNDWTAKISKMTGWSKIDLLIIFLKSAYLLGAYWYTKYKLCNVMNCSHKHSFSYFHRSFCEIFSALLFDQHWLLIPNNSQYKVLLHFKYFFFAIYKNFVIWMFSSRLLTCELLGTINDNTGQVTKATNK